MLIDTHCHLASHRYGDDDVSDLVERAREAGVDRLVTIGTDLADSRRCLEIAGRHGNVFATAGIHPTSAHEIDDPGWLEKIRAMTKEPKVVAIGEIGMDFYHPAPAPLGEDENRARQEEFFRAQLDLAIELEMPVVIHQRESFEAIMEVMESYHHRVRGVFHCFSGDLAEARHLIELGHLVSFTGIATYKNAPQVQATARDLPLESFMVETDAPYLAPVPHRGKKCEPAFTRATAEFIAELRGIPLEELASATTATATRFFSLP